MSTFSYSPLESFLQKLNLPESIIKNLPLGKFLCHQATSLIIKYVGYFLLVNRNYLVLLIMVGSPAPARAEVSSAYRTEQEIS